MAGLTARPDPIRCKVKGCPWLGHWGADQLCPVHTQEAYLYVQRPIGADDE